MHTILKFIENTELRSTAEKGGEKRDGSLFFELDKLGTGNRERKSGERCHGYLLVKCEKVWFCNVGLYGLWY